MTSWRRAPFRRAERHRRAPGGPSSLLAVAAEPRSRIRRVEVGGPPRLWWLFAVERGGALCVAPGLTEALGINVQSATNPHRWIQAQHTPGLGAGDCERGWAGRPGPGNPQPGTGATTATPSCVVVDPSARPDLVICLLYTSPSPRD